MKIPSSVYLCAGVVAAAAIAYHSLVLSGRTARSAKPTSLAVPLDRLPKELNGWVGKDVPLPQDVVENAGADTFLRRDYVDIGGNRAALYIAFYGNVQDAVPHGPTICYPSGGWATRHDEVIALPTLTPGLERLQVQKLLYEKDFSQVAVLYWYAANGEQQAGIQWLRHDSARRRLLGLGGAYVIQVMVSAPVTLSSDSSFSVVERFLRQNLDAIAKHFPPQGKRPKGGSSAPRK